MGTAAAVGAVAPGLGVSPFGALEPAVQAQAAIDWAARVRALPAPAADEIVIAAVGDLMISEPVTNRALPEAQALYQVLRDADVAFGNLEGTAASQGTLRGGFPQTAPPEINGALTELSRPFGAPLRSAGWYTELSL